jgi:hypothetical protein
MISMLPSNHPALRAASIAVAGAALLSACDTDRSTGPVPHAMPDSASLSIHSDFLDRKPGHLDGRLGWDPSEVHR